MASIDKQPTPPCHVVAMLYPGRGHINPMLNLCNAVAERSRDVRITIVVTEEWLALIGSTKKHPNVIFAAVPDVLPSEKVRGSDIIGFGIAALTKLVEPFERLLDEGGLPSPDLIIADAFMPWVGKVAGKRNIPLTHLWPMSASVYTVFYHFDLLVKNGHFPVDLSVNGDAVVDYIPGLSPIHVADLPTVIRQQDATSMFLRILPNESNAKHLVFNSIYELESQVLESLKQKTSLSIYTIGPATSYFKLRNTKSSSTSTGDGRDSYLQWLDLQPPSSVLYVSLGSYLHASTAQMKELAYGLQGSGVRFLWVSRGEASDLQEMYGDKGLIVEWCDQLRVLSHPSVGGFMSHCGWNSTKEAVLAGLPVLTFPILMDQLPDAKVVVDDWRIGWRVLERDYGDKKLKKRDEIAELVKRFMDLENPEREELVRNAKELQNSCEREFARGGSYETNLDGFVSSILSCCTSKSSPAAV